MPGLQFGEEQQIPFGDDKKKCHAGVLQLGEEQQIPFGDDNKKTKCDVGYREVPIHL